VYFAGKIYKQKQRNNSLLLLILLSILISLLVVINKVVLAPADSIVLSACRGTCGKIDYYSKQVAEQLNKHLNEGDYIYVLGKEAQLYYYTNTLPSSKYLNAANLIYSPELIPVFCKDLVRNKPKIIINTMYLQFPKNVSESLIEKTTSCLNLEIDRKEEVYFAEV